MLTKGEAEQNRRKQRNRIILLVLSVLLVQIFQLDPAEKNIQYNSENLLLQNPTKNKKPKTIINEPDIVLPVNNMLHTQMLCQNSLLCNWKKNKQIPNLKYFKDINKIE